jgi:hypothetical protein
MSDTNGGDVERHFLELQKQLQEDGFAGDSPVMKTTSRLMRALSSDGFAFAVLDAEPTEESVDETAEVAEPPPEVEETPEAVAAAAAPAESHDSIIRAFRTKDAFDSTVIESVFASIDGWKTRVVQHKGNHFVIATNAKRLTENRVKQALVEYVTELKAAQA